MTLVCVCKVLRTTFTITWLRGGDCSSVTSLTPLFWICTVFRTCAVQTTVSTVIPLVYSYFKYSQCCVWRSRYEIHRHCGYIILQFSTLFFFTMMLCFALFIFVVFFLTSLLIYFHISFILYFLLAIAIIWEPVSCVVVHFLGSSLTVRVNSHSILFSLTRRLPKYRSHCNWMNYMTHKMC